VSSSPTKGDEPRYRPVYRETDATTLEWHDWLVQCTGDEPSELSTIADVCAAAKVRAVLHDEAGFVRGQVDVDGTWTLS
jgi:hypothetical protein